VSAARRYRPVLGRRQRVMMFNLADRGAWYPGCGWQMGPGRETQQMLAAMAEKNMVESGPRDSWHLTTAGYAWIIHEAADGMAQLSIGHPQAAHMTSRIAQLARLAELSVDGAVNWKGERVVLP
jgi:hypothetical protein